MIEGDMIEGDMIEGDMIEGDIGEASARDARGGKMALTQPATSEAEGSDSSSTEPIDSALEALFAGGFPRQPVEELRALVENEVQSSLVQGDASAALEKALDIAERAIHQVDAQRVHLKTLPSKLACKPGCQSCCFLRVEISSVEADRLWPRLLELGLRERVREARDRVAHLDKLSRLQARVPCALLSPGGECLVHDLRPFACRAANSLDASACERHISSADVLGAIPIDPVPFALQRSAALGFRAACANAGMPSEVGELHAMLMASAEREER